MKDLSEFLKRFSNGRAGNDLHSFDRRFIFFVRNDDPIKPHSSSFFCTLRGESDGSDFSGKSDLSPGGDGRRNDKILFCRGEGEGEGEVNGWFHRFNPADRIDKHILISKPKSATFGKNGKKEIQPSRINSA